METNNELREALKEIGHLVEQIHFLYSDYPSEIHEIARKVNATLAEPVKNYEVGSPEEQLARFKKFCARFDCCDCPVRKKWNFKPTGDESCLLLWTSMPYEE